jgi:hypothetical protein
MSDPRHIYDPIFSSLKMEAIRLFFFLFYRIPLSIMTETNVSFMVIHCLKSYFTLSTYAQFINFQNIKISYYNT